MLPVKVSACHDDRKEIRKETVPKKLPRPAKVEHGADSDTNTATSDELSMAVAAINQRDLAELRSFRNPPMVVSHLLEAVAVLLGASHTPWPEMKKLLNVSILGRLRSFDPCYVTAAQI